jgi:beta-N-acetylhexosaminidase
MGPAEAAAHNASLQAAAAQTRLGIPILNGADFEKGTSTLVNFGTTDLPSQMGLGATRDLGSVETAARITAAEGLAMGFHWTFSPVADVVTTPRNGETGTRSFGERTDLVASTTEVQVETYRDAGLIPTAKHFPGMGGSETNSHFALPRVSYGREVLGEVHLPPFRAAIDAGVDTIMTGHIVVEAIDPELPATLSPAVTTGLLREELGFEGVILTDAMSLEAIVQNWGFEDAAILAVQAGADIVMEIGPTIVPIIVAEAIAGAVSSGEIEERRIDESVRRILSLKCEYGLFHRAYLDATAAAQANGTAANLAAAAGIARQATTLVKNDGLLPFDPRTSEQTLVVGVTHESTVIPTPPLSHVPELVALVDELSDGPAVGWQATSEQPTAAEIATAAALAASADRVIVATYAAGDLTSEQASLVDALVATGTPVVAVSIGTPWDVLSYPGVEAYVASYALNFLPTYIPAPAALRAAVEVMFGAQPGGRLPVSLGSLYPYGHRLGYD